MIKKYCNLATATLLLSAAILLTCPGCGRATPGGSPSDAGQEASSDPGAAGGASPQTDPAASYHTTSDPATADSAASDPAPAEEPAAPAYQFICPEGDTIATRILVPEGFTRVEADGFGQFLREYPLLPDGSPVLLHDGSEKRNQKAQAAVFDMDVVSGDLQQCADSCIRLYAEYYYKNEMYDKIAFHLTNGFLVDFDTWRAGGRVSVNGNHTEWVRNASPSDSPETFEKYLRFVFTYAGTLSMDQESEPVDIEALQAGDIFLKGGSPGHVVMVLDVCENGSGEKAFLLGQGYMPAQQFHVLKNPASETDPWYYVSEMRYPLSTPEYTFPEGSLKRPAYR